MATSLSLPGAEQRALLADLERLGGLVLVESRRGATHSEERRKLLHLIGVGNSVGEAARALHLSRRTATRRLSEARAELGVATNAEAALLAVARDEKSGAQ